MRSSASQAKVVEEGAALLELVPALSDGIDDWQERARCRHEPMALFFGPNRFEPKRDRLARESAAKAVCADCPVIVECREHALRAEELYGVWGGLGEAERRAVLEGGAAGISAVG